MRKALLFFIPQLFFWMLFFAFFRVLFFLSVFIYDSSFRFYTIFPVLYHSLRLDLAMVGYAMLIPVLLFCSHQLFYRSFWHMALKAYVTVVLFIFSIILTANIFLYQSWGTLINYRALTFLADFHEVFASVKTSQLVVGIFFILLVTYFFSLFFKKYVSGYFLFIPHGLIQKTISLVLLISTTVLMIRGGWQLIPISESAAFFHENIKLNHLATNPIWALGHNVKQGLEADETRYFFYDDEVAEEKVAALYTTVALTDTSSILNCTKPNIVVVMIESFTADLINALGGDKQTAPQLEKIIQEGLLFSNIFSSGERTDQAFVSVLSGFPAQPERSIMRFPDKTRKLPSLPDELSKVGYTTSFYYGGELGFSNLNSYLINCRFGSIVGIDAFERNQLNSKWGAHDAFVLARQLHDLNTMKEPFFSFLMTLTSHEPYETPIPTPFTGSDPASKFRGSAWYTDKSIGEWFEKAKQQPWFNHTLFVFVADHGHILPKNRSYYDISVRHIPLLLAGGALKEEYRNQKIDGIGNQHDLAATVLSQLRISTEKFVWSSNLLNPRRTHFAYLCMDDAVGWVSDSCTFVYQLQHRNFLSRMPAACSADTLTAKSYVQKLMRDFVNY